MLNPNGWTERYSGRSAKNLSKRRIDTDPLAVKIIKQQEYEDQALQDIKYGFRVPHSYNLLSTGNHQWRFKGGDKKLYFDSFMVARLNPYMKFQLLISPNDRIELFVACSQSPVFADLEGIISLEKELSRLTKVLSNRMKEAARELGHQHVDDPPIPDSSTWICESYHLGRDQKSGTDYTGKTFNMTHHDLIGGFTRVYSKRFVGDSKRLRVRAETLKQPDRPWHLEVNSLLGHHDKEAAM